MRLSTLMVVLLLLAVALAQDSYTVKSGDTMFSIAQRYGLSAAELAEYNGIPDPTKIGVGQVLKIPQRQGVATGSDVLSRVPLPGPFKYAELPQTVVQGKAFVVRVALEGDSKNLEANFLKARYVNFVPSGTGPSVYETVMGVPALQTPGVFTLTLKSGTDTTSVRLVVKAGAFGRQLLTLDAKTEALLRPEWVASERARLIKTCITHNEIKQWNSAFRLPIGTAPRITTFFGTRRSYNGGPYRSYHEGIDYGAPQGTPVYAPAAGTVGLAEPLRVRGNSVVLLHGMGVCSGYWHLSKILVQPGKVVEAGELIGLVGTTGLSTGPHLHYEIRVSGVPVDPAPWYRNVP
jgi:murein DD-endopeptidase MepM/ murein hydrolase activator NlpD